MFFFLREKFHNSFLQPLQIMFFTFSSFFSVCQNLYTSLSDWSCWRCHHPWPLLMWCAPNAPNTPIPSFITPSWPSNLRIAKKAKHNTIRFRTCVWQGWNSVDNSWCKGDVWQTYNWIRQRIFQQRIMTSDEKVKGFQVLHQSLRVVHWSNTCRYEKTDESSNRRLAKLEIAGKRGAMESSGERKRALPVGNGREKKAAISKVGSGKWIIGRKTNDKRSSGIRHGRMGKIQEAID